MKVKAKLEKPKPCPLCGGHTRFHTYDGDKFIGCFACSLYMNYCSGTRSKGIALWNRRVPSTPRPRHKKKGE